MADGLRPGTNWTELYLLGVQDAGVEDEEDVVHGDGAENVQPEPGLNILGPHVSRAIYNYFILHTAQIPFSVFLTQIK